MKKLFIYVIFVLCISIFATSDGKVFAATYDPFGKDVCTGDAAKSELCKSNTNKDPILGENGVVIKVTDLVALVTGIISVAIIIFTGFKFITSAGGPENIKKAREMLIFAVIGLIIIVFARTIIVYVAQKLLK